jgi:hypothetical protein
MGRLAINTFTTKQCGLVLFGLMGMCALAYGCAGSMIVSGGMHGQELIGLTEARLRTCAGTPFREVAQPDSALLVYYREAAIFEESSISGKGSKPGSHHGCWATILAENGRVTGVEFRPVPDPETDTHECQEIFATCAS